MPSQVAWAACTWRIRAICSFETGSSGFFAWLPAALQSGADSASSTFDFAAAPCVSSGKTRLKQLFAWRAEARRLWDADCVADEGLRGECDPCAIASEAPRACDSEG